MSQDEGQEHVELGSAADLRLERLLEDLHATVTSLALSLKALRRSPDNVVYQASAAQQASRGREQVREVFGFESVILSEPAAAEALRGIDDFLELSKQLSPASNEEALRELFREIVERLFDEARPGEQERPCAAVCDFLAGWADVPEPPPVAAPSLPTPAADAEPRVLYEFDLTYEGSSTPRPWLGRLLLAVFEHVRGLSPAEASAKLHSQALIGFDRSLQEALGDYRGQIAFRILQDGDAAPRIELLRRVTPPTG